MFPHPDQVRHYFKTYEDYLQRAARLGIVDEEFLNSRKQSLASYPIHRDNMASLMGMVGELISLAKESLQDHEEELARLTTENSELKKNLEECRRELDSIKRIPKK